MNTNVNEKRGKELNRLYDKLAGLEPGTEGYDYVQGEIVKIEEVIRKENEVNNAKDAADNAKSEAKKARIGGWVTFGVGLVATPLIDYGIKRGLTKLIGNVEQMETFTSTPGRSIGKWFDFKKK